MKIKSRFFIQFILASCLTVFAENISFAQYYEDYCGTIEDTTIVPLLSRPAGSCAKTSSVFQDLLRHKENFIPYSYDFSPQTVRKKVKLQFIVMDPGRPIQENFHPADFIILYLIVAYMNYYSANIELPTKPQANICGSCHIADERFSYELVGIKYVMDSTYITKTVAENYLVGGDSILNVVWVHDLDSARGEKYFGKAFYANMSLINSFYDVSKWIHMKNAYLRMPTNGIFLYVQVLMHEIRHHFKMKHLVINTDPERCDTGYIEYLADIFNLPPNQNCPIIIDTNLACEDTANPCTNNNMQAGFYVSPMQMGRMHREAFLGAASRYTYPVDLPHQIPWQITSNQLWDFPIRMYQNIIVKSGNTLTI